ncbi:hypothetical protein PILCRDRAFT_228881 [Piloderma croceum F 1598]|uniref:Uncharacterized protein n=1 Tax=Piloderma croceum (strain F 1598) TaxID=765440 RepID=A0A0C3FVL3_PILCF|nr:hypothetical protein PILCRDRAFT_228881 [Piloderma croceum F 1598]
MSLAPSPSVSRGGITIQPSYFTSSLYIHPLRDDILHLIQVYSNHYVQTQPTQPFSLFKTVWNSIRWTWMHFKVFDSRARDMFLKVTMRLFLAERMVHTEYPLNRVVALFGLYTFLRTQPRTKAPSLHSVEHIEIPIDLYTSIMTLPQTLTAHLTPLQAHAIYVLSALVKAQAFYILPASALHPFNPRELPREIFVQDGFELSTPVDEQGQELSGSAIVPEIPSKKKGRPTKRDKKKKALQALHQVDKWLEKNTITIHPPSGASNPASRAVEHATPPPAPITTHVLMSHPPTTTLNNYRTQKSQLLDAISANSGLSIPETGKVSAQEALHRANAAVLARMKKLDQMAAEKGLEVGGEGGERTGLGRVEKAVAELPQGADGVSGPRGGILGLLEGGGLGVP